MSEAHHRLAVLFADLGGSTRLYEEKGDDEARRIVATCLGIMSRLVRHERGRVVKTIGDEVMATFECAEDALRAADAITVEITASGAALGCHAGLHYGVVIEDEGDVYGDTVNVAARLVGLAVNGEVLTSDAVYEAVAPEWRERMRPFERRQVEGKQRALGIYSLVQASPEQTTVHVVPEPLRGGRRRLVLHYGERQFEVDEHHPILSIGRAAGNDIVLPDTWVSRRHARIKLRHGKYVLCDESSNGTWVRRRGGGPMRLHREEMILPSAGELGARPAPEVEVDMPVSFEIVEVPTSAV